MDDLIYSLMEDAQFVDIMTADILEENVSDSEKEAINKQLQNISDKKRKLNEKVKLLRQKEDNKQLTSQEFLELNRLYREIEECKKEISRLIKKRDGM